MKIISKLRISPYTRLFWTEYQLDPLRADYNIVFDQTITGGLDLVQLNRAVHKFVHDHILMNSHLIEEGEKLYWIKNASILELQIFNSCKGQADFVKQPFRLEQGPLYRFGVFKKSEQVHIFIIVFHHVLIDGLSFDYFIDQFSRYYNGMAVQKIRDQEKRISDITVSLENNIQSCFEVSKGFWSEKLKALPPKNELPYSKSKTKTNLIGEKQFSIKKSDYALWTKNLNLKVSNNNIFMLIWSVLVARYSKQTTAQVSYPVAIKQGADFIYGAHINTLIFALDLDTQTTLLGVIDHLRIELQSIVRHSYLPTQYMIQDSPIKKLNVGFAQTNLKNKLFDFGECEASVNKRFNIDIAGSELLLEYEEVKGYFNFRLRYRKDLFSVSQIHSLSSHYINLLRNVLLSPEEKLFSHCYLNKKEYEQIVYEWNKTD
ncbi:MAG: condensation domain-containing protein, partial [Pseudomonadota bacterium]